MAIDIAVQLAVLTTGLLVVAGTIDFVDDTLAAAMALVFYLAVVIGYPVTFETATRGRTLGKLAMGLRVVREDGGPIQFRHAFVRGLLSAIEIWISLGAIALITSLASARGKRLGDYLAGTVVVRERMPERAAPVTPMPPALVPWAASLELSRVPDDLALAARQFLSRQSGLAPAVRESMGDRLASSLAAVTAPPPPPGTPAWAFLAAVLAERRRRELERLGGTMLPGLQPPPAQPPAAQRPAAAQPPATTQPPVQMTDPAGAPTPAWQQRPPGTFAPPG